MLLASGLMKRSLRMIVSVDSEDLIENHSMCMNLNLCLIIPIIAKVPTCGALIFASSEL